MHVPPLFRPLILVSALVLTPAALAHTTVRSAITEGRTDDNAVKIEHGCEAGEGQVLPVIAQSVVFPTQSPVLTLSDGSSIGDLSEAVEQGGLAGLMHAIQDRHIFQVQQDKKDTDGNTVGFSGHEGYLDAKLQGRVSFEMTAPNFVADSCVKRLVVEIAIADICNLQVPTLRKSKVSLWIPNNGSRYASKGIQYGVQGVGDPAVMFVNRDQSLNPLPITCGNGLDLTVSPSAADIDANLPIPDVWR